jgi:hypothetical protein
MNVKRFFAFPAALAVVLAAGPSISDTAAPSSGTKTESVPAGQVAQWVRDLNSDRFIDREVATEKLIEAGEVSVSPLVESLADNNLEVTTRAIYILQELALSVEPQTEMAARAALEKIAEPRVTSVARRAQTALDRLDEIRQDRALADLKRLGAIITDRQSAVGFGVVDQYVIKFDDRWRGEVRDLARLRWLRNIGELIFEGPRVTDAWLQHLPDQNGLAVLTIKRASITDEGLRHLKAGKELETLSLLYVPISDGSVEYLRRVEGIQTLRIYGTQMTKDGAARLRDGLAGTEVDYRDGAFLGIGCQPTQQGCLIYTVRPNTAAEKAGLLPNDIIIEYDGRKVTDFQGLTAMIAANRPGDEVQIEIVRAGKSLTKRVKLGEWE